VSYAMIPRRKRGWVTSHPGQESLVTIRALLLWALGQIERHLQSLEEVVEGVGKDRRWRMGTPRGATGGAESADAEVVAEAPGI
jgi:hypothetical protein